MNKDDMNKRELLFVQLFNTTREQIEKLDDEKLEELINHLDEEIDYAKAQLLACRQVRAGRVNRRN